MRTEQLRDGHVWLRVADPGWADPLDPTYARTAGGRWSPPGSFPTLYLNEDVVTARINLQVFLTHYPYGPEDLDEDAAPVLVHARLPRRQRVADVHTPAGVRGVGLPAGYPDDGHGGIVGHDVCRPIGQGVHDAGLRGIRCRSARATYGAGRELAWFPARATSRAEAVDRQPFAEWFWG
jgi:hypothetical protein